MICDSFLAQFKSSGDYWMSSIGISKDGEAVWRSTGEPLAYTNFAQRVNGDTPCMSLLRDNGKWKEVNVCHFQFLKAICDKGKIMYNAYELRHVISNNVAF